MDEMGDFDIPVPHDNQVKRTQTRPLPEPGLPTRYMPDWSEEAMLVSGSRKDRKVSVYLEGNGKLWIHKDDLE